MPRTMSVGCSGRSRKFWPWGTSSCALPGWAPSDQTGRRPNVATVAPSDTSRRLFMECSSLVVPREVHVPPQPPLGAQGVHRPQEPLQPLEVLLALEPHQVVVMTGARVVPPARDRHGARRAILGHDELEARG